MAYATRRNPVLYSPEPKIATLRRKTIRRLARIEQSSCRTTLMPILFGAHRLKRKFSEMLNDGGGWDRATRNWVAAMDRVAMRCETSIEVRVRTGTERRRPIGDSRGPRTAYYEGLLGLLNQAPPPSRSQSGFEVLLPQWPSAPRCPLLNPHSSGSRRRSGQRQGARRARVHVENRDAREHSDPAIPPGD